MSEQRDAGRAYSRGYWRGSQGSWPDHRPPVPPDEIIGPIVRAAQSLRDAADGICATMSDDDEFVETLGPRIDDFDQAMTRFGEWLRGDQP